MPTAIALVAALIYVRSLVPTTPARRGPTIATPRSDLPDWMEQHRSYVGIARSRSIPMLFLGDSITHGWLGMGLTPDGGAATRALWDRLYGARRAENFGVGGDHVEHLLWRVRNGELRSWGGPDVVVLSIGTNNIGLDPPEAIAEGVAAVVEEIHNRRPRCQVVLVGLLPRGTTTGYGRRPIDDVPDPRIAQINRLIAPLGNRDRVTYIDLGDRLLTPEGRLDRELQPDHLHLSALGYRIWAEVMEPYLRRIAGRR